MAILQSDDLLVVYTPEVGYPNFLTTNANFSSVSIDSGEVYNASVVPENKILTGTDFDETDYVSFGVNLQVALRIESGSIKTLYIQNTGTGYAQSELVTISDGNARALITEVNDTGGVLGIQLYENNGGSGYDITDGLLIDFPYGPKSDMESYSDSGSGDYIDLVVESGSVVLAVAGKQQFSNNKTNANTRFTVGQDVTILLNKVSSGSSTDVQVLSVSNPVSGGASHITSDQLKTDVQEWAGENDVNLDVEVVDNTGEAGGNLVYDTSTGKLTYTRSASTIGSSEGDVTLTVNYGNRVNELGEYTDEVITTQEILNQELMYRLGKVEDSLFERTGTGVYFTAVQLASGTVSRDLDSQSYSRVATNNDLDSKFAQTIQNGITAQEEILNALSTATTFDEFKASLAFIDGDEE